MNLYVTRLHNFFRSHASCPLHTVVVAVQSTHVLNADDLQNGGPAAIMSSPTLLLLLLWLLTATRLLLLLSRAAAAA